MKEVLNRIKFLSAMLFEGLHGETCEDGIAAVEEFPTGRWRFADEENADLCRSDFSLVSSMSHIVQSDPVSGWDSLYRRMPDRARQKERICGFGRRYEGRETLPPQVGGRGSLSNHSSTACRIASAFDGNRRSTTASRKR